MKTGNTILRSILSLLIVISMLPFAAFFASAENGGFISNKKAESSNCIGETPGDTNAPSSSSYTVEFTYGEHRYVLQGGSSVALSEILASLSLAGNPEAVQVSDSALFSASDESGTWVVSSSQPFSSEEWMRVTIAGISYEIAVTDDPEGDYSYFVNNPGTAFAFVTITGYSGDGGAIAIPSELGGLSVEVIGVSAFEDNTDITSVTIPEGVASISNSAFQGCSNLESVTIQEGMIHIFNAAFKDCYSLESVTIPASIWEIHSFAFDVCHNLTSIYFGGTPEQWSGVSKGDRWCSYSGLGDDPAAKQVTFKVANGSWNDGTTADKVITVVGNNADKLIGSVIPAVGSKPATDYAAGSWDNDPLAATLTGDTVFTYTYSKTAGTAVTAKITVSKTDITGENTVEDALLSLSVQGLTDDQIENIIESNEGNGLKNWSTAQDGKTFTMSWVSGSKAADIKGLAPGTYTLAETGDAFESNGVTYEVLDSEVVFVINESGKVIYRTVPAPSDELNPENSTISYARASGNTFTVCDASRTDITVSKKEITNTEEIKGAHLVIEDRAGNVIDEWDSNGSDHIVKALANGTYVLTETMVDSEQAGSAYKIIPSSVYFTVLNGKITEVTSRILADKPENGSKDGYVLCNEDENLITVCDAKQATKITVNKFDITGKEELDGAILTIKGSDGKTVTGTPWTSSKGRKLVVELENGTYTLTETGDTVTDEDGNEYEIIDRSVTFSVENGRLTVVDNSTSSNSGDGFYDVDSDTNSIAVNDVMKTQEATITWKQDDGTVIDTTSVKYGQSPTHKDPTKQKDNQYIYTFTGWSDGTNTYGKDDPLPEVTGDVTYTAVYDSSVNSYTITWKQDDGTLIGTTTVEYGKTPTHADPTKEPDEQYTYTFAGWDSKIIPVTGEATYTATYTATLRSYTITWKQDDGTEIDTTTVEYGQMPTHADLTKEASAEFTYTFAGWTPEISSVKGEATYKATYSATVNEYTIIFKNEDGTVLQTVTVAYGETPEYTGETPTKAEDANNTYSFAGWNQDISAVTGETEYTATFTATQKASPDTGDSSLEIWAIAMVASFACLAMIPVYGRKRAKEK